MNYRSIEDLNQVIIRRLFILPHDFDLIVGIPRSGMLPASLLALYLHTPITDIDSFVNGHIYSLGARSEGINVSAIKKVLVVDDSVSSGTEMNKSKELMSNLPDISIKYAAVYVIPGMEHSVDYVFEVLALPRLFQWNILNHIILKKSCMDIDGVLCVDPTDEQNDDGPRYLDFIRNAIPLYIPKVLIGTLVTSRLEKYRAATEEWLEKNGVKYCKLVMMEQMTREERMQGNYHAIHKAKEFRHSRYNLFVESSLQQSIYINQLAKKPVLCTENFKMIDEKTSIFYAIKSGEKLPLVRKSMLFARKMKKKLLHK